MNERAWLAGIIAVLLATGCGSDPVSSTGGAGAGGADTGGTGGSAGASGSGSFACPAEDEAQLFVDDTELLPLLVLGGGGTGPPPTENVGNEASLILSHEAPSGEQHEAFLYLRGLVVGSGVSLAESNIEYRIYPPDNGGQQPPSTVVVYSGATLTGTLDVGAVAAEPDDVICGTFDLTGEGMPVVRVTGGFHHVLAPPMPGN